MVAYRTHEEWESILDEYKKSGQTQRAWCREHGINEKTLGNHLRRRGNPEQRQVRKNKPIMRSTEEWIDLLEKQRDSGKSRYAWCREHGISPDSMTSAEKRLNAQVQKSSKPEWVEFNLEAKKETASLLKPEANRAIKIRGGGLEIEIDADYPVEKLAVLIGKLVRQC